MSAAVDPKSGHGFASSKPVAMWNTKTMKVILSAVDGKILTSLPLAGGSDGAVFNPATMEVFRSHGNGTMAGARCLTLDTKTNHILTDAAEYGPPPPTPPDAAAAGGQRRGGRGPMLPETFAILVVGKQASPADVRRRGRGTSGSPEGRR